MTDLLVVKAKIKEFARTSKGTQMNVAGDLAEELSKKAAEILKAGADRADANKRKTVMPQDL